MKTALTFLSIGMLLLCASTEKNKFIVGEWRMDNLNTVDSSANVETLLRTFLVLNYTTLYILEFSNDNVLTMKTQEGEEFGKGKYRITENEDTLIIKFPPDQMESKFRITEKSDKKLKMTAWDKGEVVNILLSRR